MKMSRERILVVEDDVAIARGLCHNLKYEGYEVRHASCGNAVLPIISDFSPVLVILDLMLPGMDGFSVLEAIRSAGNDVHVIVLSARQREDDKVRALSLGADDYVTKPFGLREFLARVAAAMRRVRARQVEREARIAFGNIVIEPASKRVLKDGTPVRLTPRACELLIYFARHPGRIYARETLLNYAWPDDYEGTARTVDNFVVQIRAQIEADPAHPRYLRTVHGQGYCFDLPEGDRTDAPDSRGTESFSQARRGPA